MDMKKCIKSLEKHVDYLLGRVQVGELHREEIEKVTIETSLEAQRRTEEVQEQVSAHMLDITELERRVDCHNIRVNELRCQTGDQSSRMDRMREEYNQGLDRQFNRMTALQVRVDTLEGQTDLRCPKCKRQMVLSNVMRTVFCPECRHNFPRMYAEIRTPDTEPKRTTFCPLCNHQGKKKDWMPAGILLCVHTACTVFGFERGPDEVT